ncbi:MFS transporter [Ciceribacter naphthalenivorans]|uniref:MFS transporter n=3 Tax=Alphaproteobacteria TaxID=28211 RepID=A0A512HPM2_9HYPH|nr:MFS transporter [Sphingomonas psychrolutea]GEO87405.1 MFS transporter [Ciceribacter naphthalenivorans]GLR23751.1 MFS transporter [Ciceribacter naphthalenivorans]GLT06607.1 MFS transporter [Sphingomonas psychrolutea]
MALLLSTLFLFLGNGLHGLLLPVRGSAEGYSNEILGLLGTSWATGFVAGCLIAPKLVMRVGHVRAFSSFISLIAIIALLSGILVDQYWWVGLRAVTGFCIAGTSMIIESWLNERATNESRGTIFSFYISVTLIGVVGGQMLVGIVDPSTTILFMVCGILYCLATLPTTVSTAATPQPLTSVRLNLPRLYHNSPVSFVGILMIGIANGAYGTLAAVFGSRAGMAPNVIAIMLSVTIFVGAIIQFPAGKASDRIDRRFVLAALSALAALAAIVLIILQPHDPMTMIILVAVYGAAANALYPIAVAHANDFASADEFVQVSGGLLLLYGIGTIIGPTIGGPVMTLFGPHALFAVTAMAHVLLTGYAIYRTRLRAAIPADERENVPNMPVSASPMSTPESLSLDPRSAPLPEQDDSEIPEQPAGATS